MQRCVQLVTDARIFVDCRVVEVSVVSVECYFSQRDLRDCYV